jgi:hypothetical protein
MPGSRRILEVYVKSLTVLETGDRKVAEAQNALVGLLIYPVPGRPEVLATTGLIPDLHDGEPLRFDPPRLFLKEFVQGPTGLLLTLTDRDDRNALVAFLRRLASVFAGSAGQALEHSVPGLLRSAFQEAVASGRLVIGPGAEEKLQVVGVGSLPLLDPDRAAGVHAVPLIAPTNLARAGRPSIARGAANGQVELELVVREP